MNALALMATLGLDTSNYEQGLKGAGGMAQSFASSFKKVLGGVAVAGGAAVTAAGAAVVKIVKSAVTAYADYEQLVGGVETLFGNGGKSYEQFAEGAADSMYQMGQRGEDVKRIQEEINKTLADGEKLAVDGIYGPKTRAALDAYAKAGGALVREAYNDTNAAAKKVQKNADEAYKTAGLSANEYMETVTSFSAALITSLGGDTDKAADVADMAVRDMSDNANKMGTDMSMIQNAYAGFARGNYTMLDNLKLGYAGTKEGMQDLIKKANELRKAQGKTANLTINSYADIVEAIHEVQNEWGITGTTAAEAADTIEGSLNSTKAAWKNLLVSFATGKDINKRLDSLVESGKNVVKNVMPVVTTSLKSIGTFIGEVAPIIAQELPGIITEAGPAFLQAVGSLAGSLVTNFPAMLSGLGSAVAEAITGDPNADFGQVATAIITGIQGKAGELASAVKNAITGDANASWGEVAGAIGRGIRANASALAANLRVALGITENADWSQVGASISAGIKSAFTTGSEFLKGLLGVEDGESIGSTLGGAIITGINSAFEGSSGFIAGLIFGGEDVSAEAQAIEGALKGIATYLLVVKGAAAASNIAGTISTIASSVGNLTASFGTLGTGIGIVLGLTVAAYNTSEGFRNAVDDTVEAVGLLWEALTNPEAASAKWQEAQDTAQQRMIDDFVAEGGSVKPGLPQGLTEEEWLAGLEGLDITLTVGSVEVEDGAVQEGLDNASDGATLTLDADSTVDDLKSAAEKLANGEEIEFPVKFNDEEVQEQYEALQQLAIDAKEGVAENTAKTAEELQKEIDELDVSKLWGDIEAGAENELATITGTVESGISQGGASGASAMGDSMETEGARAVSAIQNLLNSLRFPSFELYHDDGPTLKKPTLGFSFAKTLHASAMNHGEILRGLTPFGVDGNGTVHYGGEAGAEAVVGVNSLDSMIQKAVSNAMAGVLGKMDELRAGQGRDMQLVLDSGELVGGIANQMNRRLGSISRWREGGHA